MEKCSNELFFILKQIIEKNSFFSTIKQEIINFEKLPKLFFVYNSSNSNDLIFNFLKSNTFSFFLPEYELAEKILISLSYSKKLIKYEEFLFKLNFLNQYINDSEIDPNKLDQNMSLEYDILRNQNEEIFLKKEQEPSLKYLKYSFSKFDTLENNLINFVNSKKFIKNSNEIMRNQNFLFIDNLIASINLSNTKEKIFKNQIHDKFQYFNYFIDNTFLKKLLEIYEIIVKKYRFNSRLRNIRIQDMIRFSTRMDIILNEIFPDLEKRLKSMEKLLLNKIKIINEIENFGKENSNINTNNLFQDELSNLFISEKNKMRIISNFIYINFLSLDDNKQMNLIAEEFAKPFNFEINYLKNYITNYNDLVNENNSTFQYLINFDNKFISFENLISKKSMYSYNSITKFFTKVLNESIINNENILLVGETGVGKTTMIQNLAKIMDTKLNVINLSQSSDSSELFGGFKPVHAKIFLQKYFNRITDIFLNNFNESENKNFLESFYKVFQEKDADYFIKFTLKSLEKIIPKLEEKTKLNKLNSELHNQITELHKINIEINKFKIALKKGNYNAFTYMDGILLEAIKNDEWILLDEINLAGDDLLLKLNSILEGGDIYLVENNELKMYKRGSKFRIFGSMNPEYNVGKKRLPIELRNLFTEFFIPEIKEFHDIKTLVKTYIGDFIDDKSITEISKFYMLIKEKQASNEIFKANFSKCCFSLRNLSRCLLSIKQAVEYYDNPTSITEAFEMNFFSQLSEESNQFLKSKFLNSFCFKFNKNENQNKIDKTSIRIHTDRLNQYFNLDNYFIKSEYITKNLIDSEINKKFILTKTFRKHFINLMRIITLSNYAVLLEGPTSCGKTSVIEYIGKKIGQKVLRINNNQNTEVEEYIGNYTSDSKGQFYFQEGFLVKAVREGHWIILDEINLAPSEVLEALNRLLDENRELYISETNTVIKAHPNFKIFAAMNPSESYGGRKDLSEAFKNRFIHIYFDNIPEEDLEEIIEKRCSLAKSRVKMMVSIFKDLQQIRSSEKVFSRKEGFMTIRDLIKWGSRNVNEIEDLAYEGYFVIAEKVRTEEEKLTIKKVIEKHVFKNKKILNLSQYYQNYCRKYFSECFEDNNQFKKYKNQIFMNKLTMRLLTLMDKSLKNKEPVLLIGETGCGKTIISEFLAEFYKQKIRTISCHENLDISDFLGSLRSVYGREVKLNNLKKSLFEFYKTMQEKIFNTKSNNVEMEIDNIYQETIYIENNSSGLLKLINMKKDDLILNLKKFDIENFILSACNNYKEFYETKNLNNKNIISGNEATLYNEFKSLIILENKNQFDLDDEKHFEEYIGQIKISNLTLNQIHNFLNSRVFEFTKIESNFSKIEFLNFLKNTFLKYIKMKIQENNILNEENNQQLENTEQMKVIMDGLIKIIDNKLDFEQVLNLIFERIYLLKKILNNILILIEESNKLFEWVDGPLTESMKNGEILLIDEISLTLDSVLERMNSVFETDRILVLSEKQTHNLGGNVESIVPLESFSVIASMSPAGDHGKRELSPALRSRFSEIFIDNKTEDNELIEFSQIINFFFAKNEFKIFRNFKIDFNFIKENENSIFSKFIDSKGKIDLELFDSYKLILFKVKNCTNKISNEFYCENNKNIVENINVNLKDFHMILSHLIFSFYSWYNYSLIHNQSQIIKIITFRDIDLIIEFLENNSNKIKINMDFIKFYNHSIMMLIIDGIFLNESSKPESLIYIRNKIIEFLNFQIKYLESILLNGSEGNCNILNKSLIINELIDDTKHFGITPFLLEKQILQEDININPNSFKKMDLDYGKDTNNLKQSFVFTSTNIKDNLLKVVRALSTKKPILIEGSPGVGKTTIIQNIAKKINKKIYRINLSEHTDMIDLIGSDFPTDEGNSSSGIVFKWIEGVFLKAMINGDWIIIDEMNLASQSILEGLNSVLDYRKSLYVSELNKEFKCHSDFQIFATQNPVNQGGGRKFLPKSFLNRFIKIYLNDLSKDDYKQILINLYPSLNNELIEKLTFFNYECQRIIFGKYKSNMNEVGEFNLRTLNKVIDYLITLKFQDDKNLIEENVDFIKNPLCFRKFYEIIKLNFIERLRKLEIKKEIKKSFLEIFKINDSSIVTFKNLKLVYNKKKYLKDSKICYLENFPKNSHHTTIFSKYIPKILLCIENNYPVILTGESGMGKKEIIRYIAKMTKNDLYEFCLNSSMDSTELLGNYDKINFSYHLKCIKEEIYNYISEKLSNQKIERFEISNLDYLNILNVVDYFECNFSNSFGKDTYNKKVKDVKNLKKSFDILIEKLKNIGLSLSMEKSIRRVIDFIESESFNFEWHDSSLIRCIEKGHWIILDNVNTCSAAVLDRLNSLLDDDKQIYLNECGTTEPRSIKAHKNFKIFMIMNDKFGEVSRALKNRCVEIYFDKIIFVLNYSLNNNYEFENINNQYIIPNELNKFQIKDFRENLVEKLDKISFEIENFKFKSYNTKNMKKTAFKILLKITNQGIKSTQSIFKNLKFFINNKIFTDFLNITNKFIYSYQISYFIVIAYLFINILSSKQVEEKLNINEKDETYHTDKDKKLETLGGKIIVNYRNFNKFLRIINYYLQKEDILKKFNTDNIIKAIESTVNLLFISESKKFWINEKLIMLLNLKIKEYFSLKDEININTQFNIFTKDNFNNSFDKIKNCLINDSKKLLYYLNFNNSNLKVFDSEVLFNNELFQGTAISDLIETNNNKSNLFSLKYLIQKHVISLINQLDNFKQKINTEISKDKQFQVFMEAVYNNDKNLLFLKSNYQNHDLFLKDFEKKILTHLQTLFKIALSVFNDVNQKNLEMKSGIKTIWIISDSNTILSNFLDIIDYQDHIFNLGKSNDYIEYLFTKLQNIFNLIDQNLSILNKILIEYFSYIIYVICLDYINKILNNDISENKKEFIRNHFNSFNITDLNNTDNNYIEYKNNSVDYTFNDLLKVVNNLIFDSNINELSEKKLKKIFKEYFYSNLQTLNVENHLKKILKNQDENIRLFFEKLKDLCNNDRIEPFNFLSICKCIKFILNINNESNGQFKNKNKIYFQNDYFLNFIKTNPETFLYLMDNLLNKVMKKRKQFSENKLDKNYPSNNLHSIISSSDLSELFLENKIKNDELKLLKKECLNLINNFFNFSINKNKNNSNKDQQDFMISKNQCYFISDVVKIISFNPYLFNDIFFQYQISDHSLKFNLLNKNSNLNQSYYSNSILEKIYEIEFVEELKKNINETNNKEYYSINGNSNDSLFLDINTFISIPIEKNYEFYQNFINLIKNKNLLKYENQNKQMMSKNSDLNLYNFKISLNSQLDLQIISLDFERKSVKILRDILSLKYHRLLFEKVKEILTNENVFLCVVSKNEDMKIIYNYINNFINYSDYMNDLKVYNCNEIMNGIFLKELTENNFKRKINMKNLFENSLLEYLFKNLKTNSINKNLESSINENILYEESKELIALQLVNLFIFSEMNDNFSQILINKNKDAEIIIDDLIKNQQKLITSPFYYFYSKINCENILNSYTNIENNFSFNKRISFYIENFKLFNQIIFKNDYSDDLTDKKIIKNFLLENIPNNEIKKLNSLSGFLLKLEFLTNLCIPEKHKISKILGKDIIKVFYEEQLLNKKKLFFVHEINETLNNKLNKNYKCYYYEGNNEIKILKRDEKYLISSPKNIKEINLEDISINENKINHLKKGNYRGENYDLFLTDFEEIVEYFLNFSNISKTFLIGINNEFVKFEKKNNKDVYQLDELILEYFLNTKESNFVIENYETIKNLLDFIDHLIIKIRNFASKQLIYFDDLISPFSIVSMIYLNLLKDFLQIFIRFIENYSTKIENNNSKNIELYLDKKLEEITIKAENNNLFKNNIANINKSIISFKFLNYLLYENIDKHELLKYTLQKTSNVINYLSSDEYKLNIQSNEENSSKMNAIDFKNNIKLYQDLNMKVVEKTFTIDEFTKDEKLKMNEEQERKEIEENFPTYTKEFDNFEKLDLIQLQKNINVRDHYDKNKSNPETLDLTLVKQREIFFNIYKFMKNLIYTIEENDTKSENFSNSTNYYNLISSSYENENLDKKEFYEDSKFFWIKNYEDLYKKLNFPKENVDLKLNILNDDDKYLYFNNLNFKKQSYFRTLEIMYKFYKIFCNDKNDDISQDIDIKTYKFSNKTYNFYKDSNQSEMKHLYLTLNKVVEKVSLYLKDYEDHPLLVLIIIILTNLLELPYTTPLSKVVSGLDLLLTKMQEWETYASKKINSLQNEITNVMILVRRLRKIEILSWKCFLNSKLEEYEKKDIEYFFDNIINIFFEIEGYFSNKITIFKNTSIQKIEYQSCSNNIKDLINENVFEEIDNKINEILDTINLFVINSNISSFYFRIKSIKILSFLLKFTFRNKHKIDLENHIFKEINQLKYNERNNFEKINEIILKNSNKNNFLDLIAYFLRNLINSLDNTHSYYEVNFIKNNKFEEFANLQINEIEEKVKNLTQIAKWDIKNYFNFKENMHRNYKQLNKILKKFDNFCLTTFKEFIEFSSKDFIDKEYVFKFIPIHDSSNDSEVKVSEDKKLQVTQKVSYMNIFENINQEIFLRLESLKKLSIGSKSKVFKHKALIDLIKTLKDFGFKSTYKFYQKEVYDLFKKFYINFIEFEYEKLSDLNRIAEKIYDSKIPNNHLGELDSDYLEKTKKCGAYICKILEKINHFNLIEIISEDLNKKYLETMRGLSFSLFFKSLSSYGKLEKIFSEFPLLLRKNYFCNKNTIYQMHLNSENSKFSLIKSLFLKINMNINSFLLNNEYLSNLMNIHEIKMLFPEKEEKENKDFISFLTELKNINKRMKLYLYFIYEINSELENVNSYQNIFITKEEMKNFKIYITKSNSIINEYLIPLIKENYSIYDYKFKPINESNEVIKKQLEQEMNELHEIYFSSIMDDENRIYDISSNLNIFQFEHEKLFQVQTDAININGITNLVDDLYFELLPEKNHESNNEFKENEKDIQMDLEENIETKPITIETLSESIDNLENLIKITNCEFQLNAYNKIPQCQNIKKIFLTMKCLIDIIFSLFKLTNLSISIFYNLSVNGFCQEDNFKNAKSLNQEGGVFEGGMGMSDGQGVEDISKEIEDEEQLLGLKDDDKKNIDKNNQNKNEKKDKKSGFEVKTDFNEDQKMEFSENEEEEMENDDNSDIEREKDKVDRGDDNKMYDKDNEIQDENDKNQDCQDQKNSKVDLTDKNVEIQDNQEDNDYKAKDDDQEDKRKNKKGKEVDKPENHEKEKDLKNKNDEQQENNDTKDKNDINKIEKLDVEESDNDMKNEEKKVDEKNGENIEENQVIENEEKEEVSEEKTKNKEENIDQDQKNNEEKLNKEMEVDNENIENPINNSEESNDKMQDEGIENPIEQFGKENENLMGEDLLDHNENEKNMEIEDENFDNNNEDEKKENQNVGEEEKSLEESIKEEEQESLFKSKPLPTDKKDLGYNPISNKQGSKGNTAQQSNNLEKESESKEDNKNENNNEEIEDNNINNVNKYQEALDLNAMMESVWLSRPSNKNLNKNNNKNNNCNPGQNKNAINNFNDLNKEQKENIKENFDFKDYQKEEINDPANQNNNENIDFDTGFAENMDNQTNSDENKYARGFDKNKNEKQNNSQNFSDNQKENDKNDINDDKENNNLQNECLKINKDFVKIDLYEESKKANEHSDKEENIEELSDKEMEIDDIEDFNENEEELNKENHVDEINIDDYIKLNLNKEINNKKNEKLLFLEENNEKENNEKIENLDEKSQEKNNEISFEDIKKSEAEMIQDFQVWLSNSSNNNMEFNMQVWNKLEQLSLNNINKLTEQLKIVFEPNKQTKLRGNYKSGKRLNIKKIISFIASNYRNDKIWLRRTLPHERNYYVMLAIDDSLSMKEHNLGFFAMESLVIVSTALNKVN